MKSRVIERNMFYCAGFKIFEKARGLRKNMTPSEMILWKLLKNRKIFKVKFRRQHPIDIFIADFYCHELKLAIEIDGEIHSEPNRIEYNIVRTHELEKLGIKVLRFSNEQISFDIKNVTNRILLEIRESTPLQGGRGV